MVDLEVIKEIKVERGYGSNLIKLKIKRKKVAYKIYHALRYNWA